MAELSTNVNLESDSRGFSEFEIEKKTSAGGDIVPVSCYCLKFLEVFSASEVSGELDGLMALEADHLVGRQP